jgi:hypothetical protein
MEINLKNNLSAASNFDFLFCTLSYYVVCSASKHLKKKIKEKHAHTQGWSFVSFWVLMRWVL